MKTRFLPGSAILAILSFPALGGNIKEVSFGKDIRPLINDYCLSCHQPGGKGYEKSGLDLRTYQSAMKGTRYGAVIKPGDSFASTLIMLVEGSARPFDQDAVRYQWQPVQGQDRPVQEVDRPGHQGQLSASEQAHAAAPAPGVQHREMRFSLQGNAWAC